MQLLIVTILALRALRLAVHLWRNATILLPKGQKTKAA